MSSREMINHISLQITFSDDDAFCKGKLLVENKVWERQICTRKMKQTEKHYVFESLKFSFRYGFPQDNARFHKLLDCIIWIHLFKTYTFKINPLKYEWSYSLHSYFMTLPSSTLASTISIKLVPMAETSMSTFQTALNLTIANFSAWYLNYRDIIAAQFIKGEVDVVYT